MEKLDEFMTCRLSQRHLQLIEQRATARGEKPSAYARRLMLLGLSLEDTVAGAAQGPQSKSCSTMFNAREHGARTRK